jgi:hypothetical protein
MAERLQLLTAVMLLLNGIFSLFTVTMVVRLLAATSEARSRERDGGEANSRSDAINRPPRW